MRLTALAFIQSIMPADLRGKKLFLKDVKMGVRLYTNAKGEFWVQFIDSEEWGDRLYRPNLLVIRVRIDDGISIEQLAVSHGS